MPMPEGCSSSLRMDGPMDKPEPMNISIYVGVRSELDLEFQRCLRNLPADVEISAEIKKWCVEYCRIQKEESEVSKLRNEFEEFCRKIMSGAVALPSGSINLPIAGTDNETLKAVENKLIAMRVVEW